MQVATVRALRYIRSTSLQNVTINFVILILNLVSSVFLSRAFGPNGRGEVTAVLLWPLMFLYLFSFGLPDTVVYFAAAHGEDIGKALANSLIATAVISVIFIPVIVALLPYLMMRERPYVTRSSRLLKKSAQPHSAPPPCLTTVLHLAMPGGFSAACWDPVVMN